MEETVLSSFSTTHTPGTVCYGYNIWVLMWLAFSWGFHFPNSGPSYLQGAHNTLGLSQWNRTHQSCWEAEQASIFRPIPTEILPPPPHLTRRTITACTSIVISICLRRTRPFLLFPPYRKPPSHALVSVTLQPLVCLLLNYIFRLPHWVMVFFSSLSSLLCVCVWQLLMIRGRSYLL